MVGEKGEGAKVSGLKRVGLQIVHKQTGKEETKIENRRSKNTPLSFFGSIFSLILLF